MVESAINNCWKVLGKNAQFGSGKGKCAVLNSQEFTDDYMDYLSMVDDSNTVNIKFVETLETYEEFEEYSQRYKSAKNVVILRMPKSVCNSIFRCEDMLKNVLDAVFGNELDYSDMPFMLESNKNYFVGMYLEY